VTDITATAKGAGDEFAETKLELAAAYLDMGDPVGARSLLEEVLQEGNVEQRQRAKTYMEQLG
jgi:pilus assembly protein FimV